VEGGWKALVAGVGGLVDAGVSPGDAHARQLAQRWMTMVNRDTAAQRR